MFGVRRTLANLLRADDYYKSIQPLLFFTQLIGVTSYVVVTNEQGLKWLAYSRHSYIVAILIVGCLVYTTHYELFLSTSCVERYVAAEIRLNVGEKILILSQCLGGLNVIIMNFINRRLLLWLFKYYAKIDKRLERIGIRWHYRRMLLIGICGVTFMNFVQLFNLVVFIWVWGYRFNYYPAWPVVFVSLVVPFCIHYAVLVIGILMLATEVRMRALKKVLKNLAHQWDNSIVKPMPKQRSLQCLDSFSMYTIVTNNPCEIIQESMEIHQMICDAASTANKYFTYQLLTIISIAFLIIVFDAYYVLETLLGKSAHESKFKTVEFVTFFSCQMILYLIAIISIVEGSNRAIKKSEKTGGIVHSLLNKAKNAELKEKLQQFSLQLLHLKIHFTAAGLFNIDRTLYFTISGALTTYLIILLQFTSNNEPEQQSTPVGQNGTTPLLNLVANLTSDA